MPEPSVAIIDIGSNSIKLLVAARGANGRLTALQSRTIEVRISAGISRVQPRLTDEGMARGLTAIETLLAAAAPFSPQTTVLVATSAVRDAENGETFREKIRTVTEHGVRILTGEEEANYIGRGLTCDPSLQALDDFYVFDLGGGSLECLAFRTRKIQQAVSLQLGCVRLTEKFVHDASEPFSEKARLDISRHTQATLEQSGFSFSLPGNTTAVGTGGTVTTVRAILAAKSNLSFEQASPVIAVDQMRDLLRWLGPLPLAERQKIPGLPSGRADIFPTALVTLIAIAEAGGLLEFKNSLYNLRWGLAAEALISP